MRASEELQRHTLEAKRLNEVVESKRAALETRIANEPGGSDALSEQKLLITRNPDLVDASDELKAAVKALEQHRNNEPDPVRNYRVIDLATGEELDQFRTPYEQASSRAMNVAAGRAAHYDLLEQQPDGEWVSYWDSQRGK